MYANYFRIYGPILTKVVPKCCKFFGGGYVEASFSLSPTHPRTHPRISTNIRTYTHTHTCTHSHTYIYIRIHTHTQIPRVSALNLGKYLFKKIKREIFGKIDISQTTRDQELSFGTKVGIYVLCRSSEFRLLISVNIYLKK